MAKRRTARGVQPMTKTNQNKLRWTIILLIIMVLIFGFAPYLSELVAPALNQPVQRVTNVIEAVGIVSIFLIVAIMFFLLFSGWLGLVAGLLLIMAGIYLAQRVIMKNNTNLGGGAL